MTFIDRRMAERIYKEWRKENPEEAKRLDNMNLEELMKFLTSKGFRFEDKGTKET